MLPPPAYIPPQEKLDQIRGGDREGQKAAVLELYADAGDFDAFASGLAASLTAAEIDVLIADPAEEDLWATLGMDMPVMPVANVESPAGTESNISMNIPDFIPLDEDLSVIRTADKETKKDAIFDLLDESGTVDAFLSGLAGSLEPEEISSLAFEFADDADIWDALGIPQPQLPLEEVVVETSSEEDIPFDSSVDGAEPGLGLIGLDPTTSV